MSEISYLTVSDVHDKVDYDWVDVFLVYATASKLCAENQLSNPELDNKNKTPGFYVIMLPKSKVVYFGHSGDLYRRKVKHLSMLRQAMARRISDPSFGANHSQKLKVFYSQPDVRQQQSDRIKQAWINPVTRDNMLKANHAKRRPVIIEDVEYESAQHAADALGATPGCVVARLKSRHKPSWRYKNERH